MQYPVIWFAVEKEIDQGWSSATEIEATSAAVAVAQAAKEEGTYRVHPAEAAKTLHFWVPAWGLPQLLKGKSGRSLS